MGAFRGSRLYHGEWIYTYYRQIKTIHNVYHEWASKKVFSLDIKKVLLEHPYVDNCAVVPIADSITFQKPIAFIILKTGEPHDVNIETEFIVYAEKNQQDGYKPVKYTFVDRFPLTKVGKVDYLALEKETEQS